MGWWTAAAPYLEAAGVVVALVLGVANLGGLVAQARRSRATHAIALEAHEWARDRREAEKTAAERQAARLRRFAEVKRELASTLSAYIDIPADLDDPEILAEGERLGYFRRVSGTLEEPGPFLARAKP